MCGITGIWRPGFAHPARPPAPRIPQPSAQSAHESATGLDDGATLLAAMGAALAHRGPDDAGQEWLAAVGLGLAHRRLAVTDPGPGSRQPLWSPTGRYLLAFNGEIDNREELRRRFSPPPGGWHGPGDAEVVAAALDRWGPRRLPPALAGMFALAVWDATAHELILVRDRFGEKPLYYGTLGPDLVFASQLVALRRHPLWDRRPDPAGVAAFFAAACVTAPHSIGTGIRQLLPGSMVIADDRGWQPPHQWWSWQIDATITVLPTTAAGSPAPPPPAAVPTQPDPLQALAAHLRQSLLGPLTAPVPIGIWLSGGIDSMVVAAVAADTARELGRRPPPAFTVTFSEPGFDEGAAAALTARTLGLEHQRLRLTARDAFDLLPTLVEAFDEPFADSSALAALWLARHARGATRVCLTGDGGDEVFGGYHRYRLLPGIHRFLTCVPTRVRRLAAALMRVIPPAAIRRWLHRFGQSRWPLADEKWEKLIGLVAADDLAARYRVLTAPWPDADLARLLPETARPTVWPLVSQPDGSADAIADRIAATDVAGYLPDDLLTKTDRAGMAFGLELRAPLLDHRLVAWVRSLPTTIRDHPRESKPLLRGLIRQRWPVLPTAAGKAGFAVPLARWLTGPWRSWAEDRLAPGRLRTLGLASGPVRAAWDELRRGKHWRLPAVWSVLIYSLWIERWGSTAPRNPVTA